MSSDCRKLFAPIVGLLASAWLVAAPVGAQEQAAPSSSTRWSVHFRMGYANATGDLGDLSDEGLFGGVGIFHRVSPRVGLGSDVSLQRLRRSGRPRDLGGILGPRTDLWHLLGASEIELTSQSATPWSIWAILGAGASILDVSGTLDDGASIPADREWKPTLALAMKVGYGLSRNVDAFGRSEILLMLGDRTAPDEFLGKEAVMGTSLGLRFSF